MRTKLYYSISEVADLLKLSQPTLRHWEAEFKELNPKRTPTGIRQYSQDDIRTLKQIIFLVNNQKLSLEGARRRLADKQDLLSRQVEILERLKRVREALKGIASHLPND